MLDLEAPLAFGFGVGDMFGVFRLESRGFWIQGVKIYGFRLSGVCFRVSESGVSGSNCVRRAFSCSPKKPSHMGVSENRGPQYSTPRSLQRLQNMQEWPCNERSESVTPRNFEPEQKGFLTFKV